MGCGLCGLQCPCGPQCDVSAITFLRLINFNLFLYLCHDHLIMREIYIIPFLVQGTTVMLSYILYWPNENLWAGLNDRYMFYIWAVSASISAASFVYYSEQMINYPDTKNDLYEYMSIPYCMFLLASSCYMPFAVCNHVVMTMLCLFFAGVCTIILFAGTIVMFGLSPVTFLMGFLCFHCVMIDFIFWGFTWIYHVDVIYA